VGCLITNSDVSGRASAGGNKSEPLDYATAKLGGARPRRCGEGAGK
jgi:hypothetical protein